MGNIYIVRHGVTNYNQENRFQGQLDIPLNEEGLAQVAKLGNYFQKKPVDVIYSSDLKRAYQTAEAISNVKDLQIRILPGLREVNVGKLEGMTWAEVKENYPNWARAGHNHGYPGGETRLEIENRVKNSWEYIAKRHSNDNVVLVSHGGIIKSLICLLLGVNNENRSKFVIDNSSITRIIYNDSGYRIKSLNSLEHLEC